MGNVNLVVLMGNLTKDPEMRQTQGGMAVCGFGMAINTRKKQQDGTYVDGDPTFVDLVAWEHNAVAICKFFTKGRSIHVTGRLHFSQWQDQQGGKHSKLEVIVDRWEFPDKKADAPPPQGGYQPQQQQ